MSSHGPDQKSLSYFIDNQKPSDVYHGACTKFEIHKVYIWPVLVLSTSRFGNILHKFKRAFLKVFVIDFRTYDNAVATLHRVPYPGRNSDGLTARSGNFVWLGVDPSHLFNFHLMKKNHERTVCCWFRALRSWIILVIWDAIAICTEVTPWCMGATWTHLNGIKFIKSNN